METFLKTISLYRNDSDKFLLYKYNDNETFYLKDSWILMMYNKREKIIKVEHLERR